MDFIKILEGILRLKEKAKKKKGRGFESAVHRETIDYESVRDDTNDEAEPGPQRCKTLLAVPSKCHRIK